MTTSHGFASSVILIVLLSASIIPQSSAQTNDGPQDDPNPGIFMRHLRANWDDIHDVIMRFHHEDPGLKGVAYVSMVWREGALASASVDSNNTGNPAFGPALIAAMKSWRIEGLAGDWATTIPFRTAIYGSNRAEFAERGILTGKVTDRSGIPVAGARLILLPEAQMDAKPDTCRTNREGIFIRTLIVPGVWRLECSRDGYSPTVIDGLAFEKGKHVKQSITMVSDQPPAAPDSASGGALPVQKRADPHAGHGGSARLSARVGSAQAPDTTTSRNTRLGRRCDEYI